jgi:hypothetical protein
MGAHRVASLVLLSLVVGCPAPTTSEPPGPDAGVLSFEQFTSKTWSLSVSGGVAQLSITDAGGPPACALASDQKRGLPAAGVQIIVALPGTLTEACPGLVGGYEIMKCPLSLGTATTVPQGCAFYRRWDASGAGLGVLGALNGIITISGTATTCTIRANVGFLGANFSETFSLTGGTGAQPWCMGS